MSLFIVRAFMRMRDELMTNAVVIKRLALIDKKLLEHDIVLRDVVENCCRCSTPRPNPSRPSAASASSQATPDTPRLRPSPPTPNCPFHDPSDSPPPPVT